MEKYKDRFNAYRVQSQVRAGHLNELKHRAAGFAMLMDSALQQVAEEDNEANKAEEARLTRELADVHPPVPELQDTLTQEALHVTLQSMVEASLTRVRDWVETIRNLPKEVRKWIATHVEKPLDPSADSAALADRL